MKYSCKEENIMEENKVINEEEIVADVEDVISETAPEEAAPEEAAPEEVEKETVEDALDELQKAAETTVEELKSAAGEFEKAAEETSEEIKTAANDIVAKIKAVVKDGNVTFIRIRKNDTVVLNLPMTVGIIGTILGLAAAPWAVILATITTIGLKCTVEVEKKDGSIILIHGNNKQDK
jgi:Fe-S cluster assembly scaffold protein SufB